MNRIRIIADEKIPFLHGVLEPFADVKYMPGNLITREAVKEADVLLVRTRTICDRLLLEGTPIKFIATATIGFDHIDTEYCKSKNIKWVNAPGCNSSSVQQYITAALVTMADENKFSLCEKTLGIIGVGNVGVKVHTAAKALGMKVKLNDPPRARREGSGGFVSLDEILKTSDIITIHVPLFNEGEDKTYHLFDNKIFRSIKKGAWLINSSRGEVVDTSALKAALSSGKLKGSILDVWEGEPDIDNELLRQVYISTPHIAGYSADGKANGTSQIVRELGKFFNMPLLDFYPTALPAVTESEFIINGSGKTSAEIVKHAVQHTYPIMQDHFRLQSSPETFEQQRGNYPLRREFSAYTVRLLNGKHETINMLEKLGFNVVCK